jgi:hypothetical protein
LFTFKAKLKLPTQLEMQEEEKKIMSGMSEREDLI